MNRQAARRLATPIALLGSLSLPLGAVPWPVEPRDAEHAILTSYGQYATAISAGGIHEATDIFVEEAPADRRVFAVEAGQILDFTNNPTNPYGNQIVISRGGDLTRALVYRHLTISLDTLTELLKSVSVVE